MKLLIITQKVNVNDSVLGFFHRWIEEFAKHFESIVVICLEKGEYDLPQNVKVLSLGKEDGVSRIKYLYRFYKYIWQERKNYNSVFVHMNQEYVLLGFLIWKILGKKVAMWRNHYAGNFLTFLASKLSNIVYFTSPHSYTARFIHSIQMPVGIDVLNFKPKEGITPQSNSILFVGRMSPVKKPDILLEAESLLVKEGFDLTASFYGKPGINDEEYFDQMVKKAEKEPLFGRVKFEGSVKNADLPDIYRKHEILVNLSPDGMFDKGIFEAMACGVVVLVANTALRGDLPEEMICGDPTPENVANFLKKLLSNKDLFKNKDLRSYVINNHSLKNLVERVEKDMQYD